MTAIAHPRPAGGLRCRQIQESDLDAVIGLFRRGFADRSERYWRDGLARHTARALPEGYPTYGYLLESEGVAVGVLLTLHTAIEVAGRPIVRCNVSTWYVEPPFRSQGSLLEKVATRRPEVVYLDVTPAPSTQALIEARGFTRYCAGQFLAIPALNRSRPEATARLVAVGDPLPDLSDADRRLLRDHMGYGCIALVCRDHGGSVPLLVQRRTIGLIPNVKRFGQVPCLQVIYCRDPADLARFGAAAGRLLLRRFGIPLVVVDAQHALLGLVGRYFAGRAPKYVKGATQAPLGDLAYTELVLFGP